MNSRQAGPRQVAEIRYGSHPGAIAAVGAHPLHTFWPLLSPHFRGVWLAPQRRSDGASVSWVWRQPGERRDPAGQDLATLRRRLQESAAGFSEDPLGSVDETVARATSEAVVRQVCTRAAEVVAGLVAKSDADLAAYVAVTETGLRLHSWGADVPAQPQDPAAQQCEISGTVLAADKPAARFTVALDNNRGLTLARTESDAEGHFVFPDVGPGNYRVRVLSDQVPFSVKGVAVRVEQESVRGIELRSHALIEAPDEEAPPADPGVEPPSPPVDPPPSPPGPAPAAGFAGAEGRGRRRLLLLLLLLAVGAGGGALAWLARGPTLPTPAQPSTFVAFQPPASTPRPVEAADRTRTSAAGTHLGAAVDRPRLGSSPPPPDFASRTSLSSAPLVAGGAAPVATAPGAAEGLGVSPEAGGDGPGSPTAAGAGGDATPEASGAWANAPAAGQSAAATQATSASQARLTSGGGRGAITTAQPSGDAKPVAPPRHASPPPDRTPAHPPPDSAAEDPNDPDVPLDADARAERAARRAVSDAKATAREETRASTDPAGAEAPDTSDPVDGAAASPSAEPPAPDGPPEHEDPLDERADRDDEHNDREQPEDTASDEERSDPVEEPPEPLEEPRDAEASTANGSSPLPNLFPETARRTSAGAGRRAAAGTDSTPASDRRSSDRAPRADTRPVASGTVTAHEDVAVRSDLGDSVTLRLETWHPRLEADVIVPTAPVPASSRDTTRALLHDAQAEATSHLPELFQPPVTQAGVILEVDADLARGGAMRWSPLAAAGVSARCLGARAELGWAGQIPPVSAQWTLHGADGAVLARLHTDRNGGIALDAAPKVRALLWVGVRRSIADSRPEHAGRWTARLHWSLHHDGREAPAGQRDDGWLGASGHRLEFPISRQEQSPAAITVRLLDRETGWALVRRVHLR